MEEVKAFILAERDHHLIKTYSPMFLADEIHRQNFVVMGRGQFMKVTGIARELSRHLSNDPVDIRHELFNPQNARNRYEFSLFLNLVNTAKKNEPRKVTKKQQLR